MRNRMYRRNRILLHQCLIFRTYICSKEVSNIINTYPELSAKPSEFGTDIYVPNVSWEQDTTNKHIETEIKETAENTFREYNTEALSSTHTFNVMRWIIPLYIAGVCCFFAYICFINLKFSKYCKAGRTYLYHSANLNLPVYKLSGISSPFIMGRTVYIPETMADHDEIYYAVLHEECLAIILQQAVHLHDAGGNAHKGGVAAQGGEGVTGSVQRTLVVQSRLDAETLTRLKLVLPLGADFTDDTAKLVTDDDGIGGTVHGNTLVGGTLLRCLERRHANGVGYYFGNNAVIAAFRQFKALKTQIVDAVKAQRSSFHDGQNPVFGVDNCKKQSMVM